MNTKEISSENLILSATRVKNIIKRIAVEIYENNLEETELVFVGIKGQGIHFAHFLQQEFDSLTSISSSVLEISITKDNPSEENIVLSDDTKDLSNKVIVLVDDVVNSGRTMMYAALPLLRKEVKKIQTAVIVNRDYKRFPISADFVGYNLSTTVNNHVHAILDNEKEFGIYLF